MILEAPLHESHDADTSGILHNSFIHIEYRDRTSLSVQPAVTSLRVAQLWPHVSSSVPVAATSMAAEGTKAVMTSPLIHSVEGKETLNDTLHTPLVY